MPLWIGSPEQEMHVVGLHAEIRLVHEEVVAFLWVLPEIEHLGDYGDVLLAGRHATTYGLAVGEGVHKRAAP